MTDVNHLATDIAAPKPAADERLRDDTWWYGPVAIACFLVFWELAVRLGDIPEIFLPRPSLVVVALYDLFAHKQLLYDLFIILVRIFGGFFLAAIVGITLGLLMGMSPARSATVHGPLDSRSMMERRLASPSRAQASNG